MRVPKDCSWRRRWAALLRCAARAKGGGCEVLRGGSAKCIVERLCYRVIISMGQREGRLRAW